MRRRVLLGLTSVVLGGHNGTGGVDDYRPDRHVTTGDGCGGFLQRHPHELLGRAHPRSCSSASRHPAVSHTTDRMSAGSWPSSAQSLRSRSAGGPELGKTSASPLGSAAARSSSPSAPSPAPSPSAAPPSPS